MPSKSDENTGAKIISFLGIFCLIAGFGFLFYQSFLWLKEGAWTAYPLMNIFKMILPKDAWLFRPENWEGLHRILEFCLEQIGYSAGLIVLGLQITWIKEVIPPGKGS